MTFAPAGWGFGAHELSGGQQQRVALARALALAQALGLSISNTLGAW